MIAALGAEGPWPPLPEVEPRLLLPEKLIVSATNCVLQLPPEEPPEYVSCVWEKYSTPVKQVELPPDTVS